MIRRLSLATIQTTIAEEPQVYTYQLINFLFVFILCIVPIFISGYFIYKNLKKNIIVILIALFLYLCAYTFIYNITFMIVDP